MNIHDIAFHSYALNVLRTISKVDIYIRINILHPVDLDIIYVFTKIYFVCIYIHNDIDVFVYNVVKTRNMYINT